MVQKLITDHNMLELIYFIAGSIALLLLLIFQLLFVKVKLDNINREVIITFRLLRLLSNKYITSFFCIFGFVGFFSCLNMCGMGNILSHNLPSVLVPGWVTFVLMSLFLKSYTKYKLKRINTTKQLIGHTGILSLCILKGWGCRPIGEVEIINNGISFTFLATSLDGEEIRMGNDVTIVDVINSRLLLVEKTKK